MNMLRTWFAHPWLLTALAALPVLGVLWLWSERRRRRAVWLRLAYHLLVLIYRHVGRTGRAGDRFLLSARTRSCYRNAAVLTRLGSNRLRHCTLFIIGVDDQFFQRDRGAVDVGCAVGSEREPVAPKQGEREPAMSKQGR